MDQDKTQTCELNQFFTPLWAAERIIGHYYPDLSSSDTVFDVGCGDGRFLMSLPKQVTAYGFEVDPVLAKSAGENSGFPVITGCFTKVEFPAKPTVCLGNPPYDMSLVNRFLDRAFEAMDYGGKVGFLLPVYFFQTADTVLQYMSSWTLKYDLMPRNLFEGMSKPVMFAQFLKERQNASIGFFLFDETADVLKLSKKYRFLFIGNDSSSHLWGAVIDKALASLGGEATTQQIYAEIEGNRPTKTQHWKAQIRKVLQQFYRKVGPATYGLPLNTSVAVNNQFTFNF